MEKIQPLLDYAYVALEDVRANLEAKYGALVPARLDDSGAKRPASALQWPPLALHVLGLLQAGYSGRTDHVPAALRQLCGRIVTIANFVGALADRKWAVEVAGIIPEADLVWLLRDAFRSKSGWLRAAAFQQVGRLRDVPSDVATSVRVALLNLFMSGRLRQEQDATFAHLMRIPRSKEFVNAMRLLLRCEVLDAVLLVSSAGIAVDFCRDTTSAVTYVLALGATWLLLRSWNLLPGAMIVAVAMCAVLPRIIVMSTYDAGSMRVVSVTSGVVSTLFAPSLPPIMATLFATWLLFALFAVRWGQFLAPWAYPLVYLSPVVVMVKDFRVLLQRGLSFLKRRGLLIVNLAAGYTVSFSVLSRYGEARAVSIVLASVILGSPVILLLVACVPYVLDVVAVRHAKRQAVATAYDLFMVVGALHTSSWRVRFLQYVNEGACVAATEENERLILDCAEDVEKQLNAQPFSARDYDALVMRDAMGFGKRRMFGEYDMAVVEALALLGEKTRARRTQ